MNVRRLFYLLQFGNTLAASLIWGVNTIFLLDAGLNNFEAFAANAFFNVLWSLLFFRFHRPDWALAEVSLLWLSILALIVVLGRLSRASGWLMAPYLAWVSFAAFLNLTVVRLNAPFGG